MPDRALPFPVPHAVMFVGNTPGQCDDQAPGQFGRRMVQRWMPGHQDTVIPGGGQIDRIVAHAGCIQVFEIRQFLEQPPRKRGAFAHDNENFAIANFGDQCAFIRDVFPQDANVYISFQRLPVGHFQRRTLIVIQYRQTFHPISRFLLSGRL